jgi:nucleoside-diphosphate-sugar epimerase
MTKNYFLPQDISEIINSTELDLLKLKNARVVITGASGFIGRWIAKTLIEANKELSLNLNLLLISGKTQPLLESPNSSKVIWKSIDFSSSIQDLNFGFTHGIHASTPSNFHTGSKDAIKTHDVALNSLESLLSDARISRNLPNLVHLSSGAVYVNSHQYKVKAISEKDPIRSPGEDIDYVTTKLILEKLISNETDMKIVKGSNPRLFAFYGPHLPMDAHFAVGNFAKNAFEGKSIEVRGNPATIRSYMYPLDLVSLLIKVLVNPKNQPINVGSLIPYSVMNVAQKISEIFGISEIALQNPTVEASSYFPSMAVAEEIYGFREQVTFEDGLRRWKIWLENQPGR